jgi:tetratricopeptide (TPR) repeat protein
MTFKKSPIPALALICLTLHLAPLAQASDSHSAKTEKPKEAAKPQCTDLPQRSQKELWAVAECFYKASKNQQAIKVLRGVTTKDPKDLEAYYILSWLLWNEAQTQPLDIERELKEAALAELSQAVKVMPYHWGPWIERGDFYALNLRQIDKAYADYLKGRALYAGDADRGIPGASAGRKASIENRIARTCEQIERKGEAVEASCRALFFDPDDKDAQARIKRLGGSCVRKGVADPRATKASAPEH